MKNVEIEIVGNIMTITVDLTQDLGPSSTGKTRIIATTSGNSQVTNSGDPPVVVGLNVYRKVPKEVLA